MAGRRSLRFPKGIPREVTRAVFRGRRHPKPGRYLSHEDAFRLKDALREYFAEEEIERAEPEEEPEEEEGEAEWEVGIDYKAHDRTSNVDFNARIYRYDGGKLSEADARAAFSEAIWTGQAPPGVAIRDVWWQRAHGRKRHGRVGHLEPFRNILSRVGEAGMRTIPLRFGAVKPGGL